MDPRNPAEGLKQELRSQDAQLEQQIRLKSQEQRRPRRQDGQQEQKIRLRSQKQRRLRLRSQDVHQEQKINQRSKGPGNCTNKLYILCRLFVFLEKIMYQIFIEIYVRMK